MLIAVGRDPNNQYFPLAFAVVETETKASWRWFLTLLLEDIGDVRSNRWVFISDQQKGLIPTFEELLEGVEHRFCLRHLYANFKKKFGGGVQLRDLMMSVAKATYIEAWEEKMEEIKGVNSAAYDWLKAIPTRSWCKHAFSFYPKCDVLMNNLSESFNSRILLARDKPIITMFEWIRTYLMGRFAILKEKSVKYPGRVMPKPRRRLDREVEKSGNWLATWVGERKFEVTHTLFADKFIVDLIAWSCTCNFWELVGLPCRHALACINYKGENVENYVHKYYLRETYELCYGQIISTINGQNKLPKTEDEPILPPAFKVGPGRPKKLRRREPDEDPNPAKLKRSHTINKCSRCHGLGHNRKSCKNPPLVPTSVLVGDENQAPQAVLEVNQAPQATENHPSQPVSEKKATASGSRKGKVVHTGSQSNEVGHKATMKKQGKGQGQSLVDDGSKGKVVHKGSQSSEVGHKATMKSREKVNHLLMLDLKAVRLHKLQIFLHMQKI